MYEMVTLIMNKITLLAIKNDKPLIIFENPNKDGTRAPFYAYRFIAGIGDTYAGFEGYDPNALVDLYADLKGKLEAQNVQSSQQSNNNTADASSN